MKRLLILTSVLMVASYSSNAQSCNVHSDSCLNGCCPDGVPNDNYLVNHSIFTLSSNKNTKLADWVSYIVEPKNLNGPSRERKWRADPNIAQDDTMSPDDYSGANAECGYSRGHQAPLGTFKNNPRWSNANYMSNITPQMAALNNGPWEKLETAERDLLSKYAKVYVVTGPYYTNEQMCALPNASVAVIVPNGYWKVVSVVDSAGNSQSVAFAMSQKAGLKDKYCSYKTTLSTIEAKTKLNILPNKQNSNNIQLVKDLGC